jgi:hypothetical protein
MSTYGMLSVMEASLAEKTVQSWSIADHTGLS